MQNEKLLKNYREQISSLDKEIIYLLSRRFIIVNEIWNIKKQENTPVLQKDIWEKLLSENIEKAQELGLEIKLIEDIWNRIHEESLRIEE